MEKNFMGVALKKVKTEVLDGCNYSASARGSAMQWSFSNQVSPPHFVSFKGALEDRSRNTGYDSLASTGCMTISTAEPLDSNKKPYSSVTQWNMNLEKQAGHHYAVANYTSQHFDAHAVHHPHEVRLLPIANRTNEVLPVSMSTLVHQPIITSVGKNVISSTVNLQSVGVPIAVAPVAVGPSSTSIVDNTDLRNTSKNSRAPAQLTIFYSGLVCVYDDVSPEKAQAILLLAGNGSSAPITAAPSSQVQAQIPRPSTVDAAVPQARKASLARFLEKRKERVMSSAPYVNKQSPDCSTLGPGS